MENEILEKINLDKELSKGNSPKWRVDECRLQFRPSLAGCVTLEDVADRLRKEYCGWFVYIGGNHVALHRSTDAESPRLLLVVGL